MLDAMAAARVDGDDETYEWLANAAVRDVEFVTVRHAIIACGRSPCIFFVIGGGCATLVYLRNRAVGLPIQAAAEVPRWHKQLAGMQLATAVHA